MNNNQPKHRIKVTTNYSEAKQNNSQNKRQQKIKTPGQSSCKIILLTKYSSPFRLNSLETISAFFLLEELSTPISHSEKNSIKNLIKTPGHDYRRRTRLQTGSNKLEKNLSIEIPVSCMGLTKHDCYSGYNNRSMNRLK